MIRRPADADTLHRQVVGCLRGLDVPGLRALRTQLATSTMRDLLANPVPEKVVCAAAADRWASGWSGGGNSTNWSASTDAPATLTSSENPSAGKDSHRIPPDPTGDQKLGMTVLACVRCPGEWPKVVSLICDTFLPFFVNVILKLYFFDLKFL